MNFKLLLLRSLDYNIKMSVRFPIPEKLNEKETAPSLEQWKTSFVTFAQRDPTMAPFLTAAWDTTQLNRGFRNIDRGLTAVEQNANCELFLRHLVSYLKTPYWNNRIIDRSTSLESVWKIFNEIFDIEHTADSLLDIASMKLSASESYSSFLARIMFHLENHLPGAGITVDNITSGPGEKMSIMVMDLAVQNWLDKIHPSLIDRVKIDYGVQIKGGARLSALAPQIIKAIPSMLKKLNSTKVEVVRVLQEYGHATDEGNIHVNQLQSRRGAPRGRGAGRGPARGRGFASNLGARPKSSQKPVCKHCKWLVDYWDIREIDYHHDTKSCRRTMPSEVKMVMESPDEELWPDDVLDDDASEAMEEDDGKALYKMVATSNFLIFQKTEESCNNPKLITNATLSDYCTSQPINKSESQPHLVSDQEPEPEPPPVRVIAQMSSPKMRVTFGNKEAILTIDEGSEINAISEKFAKLHDIQLSPSRRKASGAGGNNLEIVGESLDDVYLDTKFQSRRFSLNLGKVAIIKNLSCPIILGEPGKCENKISTNPRDRKVIMNHEGEDLIKDYYVPESTTSHLCRISDEKITIFPGDTIRFKIPDHLQDTTITISPRKEFSGVFKSRCVKVSDSINLTSESINPVNIKKEAHVADLRLTSEVTPQELKFQTERLEMTSMMLVHQHSEDDFKYLPTVKKAIPPNPAAILLDPDNQMSTADKENFRKISERFSERFTPTPGRYNGAYGPIDNSIRFTTVPIQTNKVAVPNYSPDMKAELIKIMNELIDAGVLIRPEELGITVEFLSPCLIVPKGDGRWRLVTDFTMLNRIISRHNSRNPTIQDAKVDLSKKRYRVELDLSNYYFQFGLRREDAAYLGVQHPTLGVFVYASSPQGLMNSSELAYDLLGRVYGDLMEKDMVTRIADSIYVLGDTFEELAWNYSETLRRAELCNLTFRPEKTLIAPKKSVIFGWELNDNQWKPLSHVVSSLVKAELPSTCKQLRSYLGAYKQLNSCIPNYAALLSPFEKILASRASAERINWTDQLKDDFEALKKSAGDPKGIHVPKREDRLLTSSDYSASNNAIGGALHIIRKEGEKEVKLLGGHFSAILDKNQSRWLACECEAMAVKRVLLHFEPEIRNSDHSCTHYCDNMPTVLAWRRMTQGKLSSNQRITTFLSTLSTLPVRIEHRPGSSLHAADYASRHPVTCTHSKCTICKFTKEDQDAGDQLADVRAISAGQGAPFLQTSTWLDIQKNDSTHEKLSSLIRNGQAPEKKRTGGENTVLKNLHNLFMRGNLKVDSQGLILVRQKDGFKEGYVISVPSSIFPGLCFAYHHKQSHPTKHQMMKLLSRYYYTTGMQTIIEKVTDSCLMCMSTRKLPKPLLEDSTTIPQGVGTSFCADVLERCNQNILLTKDELSHFATAVLLPDQTSQNLRQGLIQTVTPYVSETGAKIRVDAAPGFASIAKNQGNDVIFSRLKLKLELGDALNKNKNPVSEAGIGELKKELLNLGASDSPVDQALLSLATHNMNTRIRAGGKSASERMMARDIFTNKQLEVKDKDLSQELETRRKAQHKANSKTSDTSTAPFQVGDMVMLKAMSRLDKTRDLYIVTDVDAKFVYIRKSEKQWRRRIYRVKAGQLTLVPNSRILIPPEDHEKPYSAEEKASTPNPPDVTMEQLPSRRQNRSSKVKARLNIQQGYRKGINVVKSIEKVKNKKRKYIIIDYNQNETRQEVSSYNDSPSNAIPNRDFNNTLVKGISNVLSVCLAIGYPTPNKDIISDNLDFGVDDTTHLDDDDDGGLLLPDHDKDLSFPPPTPNPTPPGMSLNIMDWPVDVDMSTSQHACSALLADMIERNKNEFLASAWSNSALTWDNDTTLVSIQAGNSTPEDDVLDETLETNITIQELGMRVALHEINITSDEDPNSSQHSVEPNISSSDKESLTSDLLEAHSSTSSEETFDDLYVPDDQLLNAEPFLPPEESVSSRLRSKSSCSDRSNEDFTRDSRLRRPQRRAKSKENLDEGAKQSDAAPRDQN